MKRLFVSPCLLALPVVFSGIGCSDGSDPPTAAKPKPGPACSVTLAGVTADTSPAISEGGRSRLSLTVGSDVDRIDLGALPDGIAGALDGQTLTLKPAYGTGGAQATVSMHLTCGAAAKNESFSIAVRGIAWESLPTWTPHVDGPPSREYGSMWIDPVAPDRLLLFGGFLYEPAQFTTAWDLWEYDFVGTTWKELVPANPPHLPGGRMVPLSDGGAMLYYGGLDAASNSTPYSLLRFDDAPAPAFADVAVTKPKSSGDYLPAFVYDAPRNRYIAACGANSVAGYHCQVSAYYPDSSTWEPLATAGDEKPTGRDGLFFVNDAENERLVLFGGDMGDAGWKCDCAQDTWALELAEDPPRWVKLAGAQDPPIGRRNGAFALDPVGHRMFIWGGTNDGATTFPGLFAFDLDRGQEGWTKVETAATAPERTSGMAVYDARRSRIVFGFGNDKLVYADLWALNL